MSTAIVRHSAGLSSRATVTEAQLRTVASRSSLDLFHVHCSNKMTSKFRTVICLLRNDLRYHDNEVRA